MTVPTVITPDITQSVDQRFLIEPLGGPDAHTTYLERFPEQIYNTSLDSHLVKFLYTLLGPAGIGWLQKNYLAARLLFEEAGIELFDLDAFYGNPLAFGRVFEETYDENPAGLLTNEEWQKIRARDARYRARALDYIKGVRAGTTLEGMHYAARSGLGHDAEIIENYRYIYDQLSDDPLGLDFYGRTDSTEEFVVIPRREVGQTEIQLLKISEAPASGSFVLDFNGELTSALPYNVAVHDLQAALEGLPSIGPGNVVLDDGPLPEYPVKIYFTGYLSNRDLPRLTVFSSDLSITITTIQGGLEGAEEIGLIPPRDQHHVLEALDHLRPQTSIVSFNSGSGGLFRVNWNDLLATSSYTEVLRYATGSTQIDWPQPDTRYWIESGVEKEAPRIVDDLQHHYAGFHDAARVLAYTEDDFDTNLDNIINNSIPNEHIGPFTRFQSAIFSPLSENIDPLYAFYARWALADYSEPVMVTTQQDDGERSLVNGVYPIEYQNLTNAPSITYRDDKFWSSRDATDGTEYLEIDLGSVQAVNYVTFQTLRKPVNIDLEFDLLDESPFREFIAATPHDRYPFDTIVTYSNGFTNPWETVTLNFTDQNGQLVFTRYLRIRFDRRYDSGSVFLTSNNEKIPYSIEARNLRVGRLVS